MDGGKPTKQARVMIAKDGEEMAIHGTCDCSGKVLSRNKYEDKLSTLRLQSYLYQRRLHTGSFKTT